MKNGTLTTLAIAAVATPLLLTASAHADTRQVWTMTCFPSSSVPYEVTANANTSQLTITGTKSGHVHPYRIANVENIGTGFMVAAYGDGRRITAGFSPTKGLLVADGKFDYCSGDM